jgi:RNA-directed DNA polymerase
LRSRPRTGSTLPARHPRTEADIALEPAPLTSTNTSASFQELARRINLVVAGWLNYYSRFRPWELIPFAMRINAYLVRWIRQKYKRLAAKRKALAKMQEIARRYLRMLAHWRLTATVSAVSA